MLIQPEIAYLSIFSALKFWLYTSLVEGQICIQNQSGVGLVIPCHKTSCYGSHSRNIKCVKIVALTGRGDDLIVARLCESTTNTRKLNSEFRNIAEL